MNTTAPTKAARDRIFDEEFRQVDDFRFDEKVASVFDDMVDRSVPMYAEFQRMIPEMVRDFAVDGTNIYDLGCATGTTLQLLDQVLEKSVRLVGVDSSEEMLGKCRQKLTDGNAHLPCDLVRTDLNNGLQIKNASVVLMVLTLQFVRPLNREPLMRAIYEGLNDQGCVVLIEKVLGEHSTFNRHFIKYYYDMKRRNGYSEMEIAQKREALENVLIPYKLTENWGLLERTGFRSWDVFFKWYNFCGIIAIK